VANRGAAQVVRLANAGPLKSSDLEFNFNEFINSVRPHLSTFSPKPKNFQEVYKIVPEFLKNQEVFPSFWQINPTSTKSSRNRN